LKTKRFTKEDSKRIGESLGIDWTRFDIEQFRMGLDVELEHGSYDSLTNVSNDHEIITGKIALAYHLLKKYLVWIIYKLVVWKYREELYRFLTMVMHAPCWIWLTRP
jgi:hypothetical protein